MGRFAELLRRSLLGLQLLSNSMRSAVLPGSELWSHSSTGIGNGQIRACECDPGQILLPLMQFRMGLLCCFWDSIVVEMPGFDGLAHRTGHQSSAPQHQYLPAQRTSCCACISSDAFDKTQPAVNLGRSDEYACGSGEFWILVGLSVREIRGVQVVERR